MGKAIRQALRRVRVSEVCDALEALAPLRLAQDWDNVGLLAGDREATVRRVLLCIDLTGAVVAEAEAGRVEMVVAYHPPLFKPIGRLTVPSDDTSGLMFRCVRAGVAVYSPHTALDAAAGGTNDRIAGLCGISKTQPLEYASGGSCGGCKIVVFVPAADADGVAAAMFEAGAGGIGEYE
ncbi:MAG: Nif3-like dinuclear metal center hexameric protein, partial [Myxococcota bacterium]